MKYCVDIIVFSYNRAMQLDCLIKSILRFVRIPNYHIMVIYHCEGSHQDSYSNLINKYHHKISFIKRKKEHSFFRDDFPSFFTFSRNALWYLKYKCLRDDLDNFKAILEDSLFHSKANFVLLFTDDAIIYDDIAIADEIFRTIEDDPLEYSYKAIIGKNIIGFPQNISRKDDSYYWDYYSEGVSTHWAYPFAIDATLYHKESLLRLIKKVLYQSPVTFELFVSKYVRIKKLFRHGISPLTSKVISITINKTSHIFDNFSINIDVDLLRDKYLEGFELDYKIPDIVNQTCLVPAKVIINRGDERFVLYCNYSEEKKV